MIRRVRYVFPVSHHYRYPFHEGLRRRLAEHGVEYKVIYSDPSEDNLKKGDTVDIPWGRKVPLQKMLGLVFQNALGEIKNSDLVIIQQENKLLLNYGLHIACGLGLKRVAYFGHGRNFQARNPNSAAEKWKRFWATRVDWWFGYTDETRRHIESLGFPSERITVFNNSVDTSKMREISRQITTQRKVERIRELGLKGGHLGVFVGGLYEDKRLDFLVEAARRTRVLCPDFEMLIIGGGPQFEYMKELTQTEPWIVMTGPRFDLDKLELMSLGQLFLMPGLVGLAILDAAALGLPMVTTAFPYHSPEIAYLQDGVNGWIVNDWQNPEAYGDAIAFLFADKDRLGGMSAAARQMAETYTIENMVDRFANGVLAALG